VVNLKVFDFTKWSLRIPHELTPRYYPVEQLKKNNLAGSGYEVFYVKNKYTWGFNILINWAGSVRNVYSPTHDKQLHLDYLGSQIRAKLNPKEPNYPEKDFELIFEETKFSETTVSYSDLRLDEEMLSSQKNKLADTGLPQKGAVLQFMPDLYKWKVETKNIDVETFEDRNYEFLLKTS
jgi:hypothetical protein